MAGPKSCDCGYTAPHAVSAVPAATTAGGAIAQRSIQIIVARGAGTEKAGSNRNARSIVEQVIPKANSHSKSKKYKPCVFSLLTAVYPRRKAFVLHSLHFLYVGRRVARGWQVMDIYKTVSQRQIAAILLVAGVLLFVSSHNSYGHQQRPDSQHQPRALAT